MLRTAGPSPVDRGNPFSASATVTSDGVSDGAGANPVTGYTVIEVDDVDTAIELAKLSPVALGGRTVEVAETQPLM